MIKLAVSGSCGRMGKRIIALAKQDKGIKLTAALERKDHPEIGKIIDGVKISANVNEIKNADCLIDFTSPDATLKNLESAVKFKKPIVIGTTGITDEQKTKITECAKTIPIVFAPNMSIGVNIVFKLLKSAAEKLAGNYTAGMKEAHHVHKKDAPSGTAKKMAQILRDAGVGIENEDIKSIREGEVIGDHEVVFESDVDKITISHSAKTRDIFAEGALSAAKWIINKPAGLYSMQDVIGV